MVGQDKMSVADASIYQISHFSLASQKTELNSCANSRPGSAKNFISSYEAYCSKNNAHPLRDVKVASSSVKGTLDLVVDKIKLNDWIPLLKAVSGDRSLHSISFKSRINQGNIFEDIVTETQVREMKKGPILFSAYMMHKFVEACMNCLEHSKTIRMFHLEKIPLTGDLVGILSQGLSKTCCLQKLILVGCQFGDEGCALIGEAVKKLPSIRTLDLSANDITSKGAKHLASLIKFQDISRYNECWKHSLRCREVNTDVILGLRRLTINENHEIRDKGLKYIIDALYDDNWIKAIDMQNCGITDWGCSAVHKLLETNKEIVVFDLRKNDIVDMTAIASMISILGSHMTGDDMTEFGWMDIDSPICASSSEDSSSGGASGHTSAFGLVRSNQKVSNYILSNCQGQERLRTIQSAAALSFPRRSQTSLRQCRQLQMASRSKSLHGSMALVEFTGRSLLNRTGGLTRTSLAKARTGQKSANPARQLQVANWQADVNRRLSSLTVSKTPPPKSLRSTQSEQRLGSTKKSIPLRTVSSENKSKDVVESRKEENTGKSTEEEKILKLLELSCPKVKPAVDREESKSVARERSSILQTKNAETFSIENYPLDINAMLQTNDTVTKKHQRCSYFKRLDVDGDD